MTDSIKATGTDTEYVDIPNLLYDNQKARGNPLRDEKVANLELLKGSFWFLLVISLFFLKNKPSPQKKPQQKTTKNQNPQNKTKNTPLWIMEFAELESLQSQGFNEIQGYCEQKSYFPLWHT